MLLDTRDASKVAGFQVSIDRCLSRCYRPPR
jgi:hypothetical protein